MGVYKYIRDLWKKPSGEMKTILRNRLIAMRKEPGMVKLEKPTRLDRARSLGYKAKPGYVVVRQRVKRGGRMREKFKSGRRSKTRRRRKVLGQNLQVIAEQRVARKYTNCEVLNSYWLAKDKGHYYYEVILVDKSHKAVLRDLPKINKVKGRAFRGLTSSGQKARGLRNKGRGAEKVRGKKSSWFN